MKDCILLIPVYFTVEKKQPLLLWILTTPYLWELLEQRPKHVVYAVIMRFRCDQINTTWFLLICWEAIKMSLPSSSFHNNGVSLVHFSLFHDKRTMSWISRLRDKGILSKPATSCRDTCSNRSLINHTRQSSFICMAPTTELHFTPLWHVTIQHLDSQVKDGWVTLGKHWRKSIPSFCDVQSILPKSISYTLKTTPCVRKGVIIKVSLPLICRWRDWVIKKHGVNFPVSTSQLALESIAV